MNDNHFPISSLNSLVMIVPLIWIYKRHNEEIDIFFIFAFIYTIYIIFFSLIHNYYYEDDSIFAFIDRTLVRLLMCIFLIYGIYIRYNFSKHDFISWLCVFGFYFLMIYINSIYNNKIIFQGLHLCFRLCAFTYFSYLLLQFYNCYDPLFQFGYVILQCVFNFIIYLYIYTDLLQFIF